MKISDLQIQQNNLQIRPENIKTEKIVNKSRHEINDTLKTTFQSVLNERIGNDNSLQFSSHATKRINQRNIELTPAHLSRLEEGLGRVKQKGSQSSLLLMDKMAYIVSVRNQTVVTALSKEATQSNVFTNIDSVAIV